MLNPLYAPILGDKPIRLKGRREDIDAHMTELRLEFVGRPTICYLLACHIVRLRRGLSPEADWQQFVQLITEHESVVLKNMNLRWLVSICDTFADYGTPQEQIAGMTLVVFINLIKLSETERIHMVDPSLRPGKLLSPQPLWDGMMSYNMPKGDMPRNLFTRMQTTLAHTPLLQRLWLEAFERIKKSDTLIARLAACNPSFYELATPHQSPSQ